MVDLRTDAGLHTYRHIIVHTGIKANNKIKLQNMKILFKVWQGNVFIFLQI